MKQKIRVYVKECVDMNVSYEDFLKDLINKHELLKSEGVEKVFVESDSDYSGSVILYGDRIETDEEFYERLYIETKNIENRKNNLKLSLINFSKDCPEEFKELMKEI